MEETEPKQPEETSLEVSFMKLISHIPLEGYRDLLKGIPQMELKRYELAHSVLKLMLEEARIAVIRKALDAGWTGWVSFNDDLGIALEDY